MTSQTVVAQPFLDALEVVKDKVEIAPVNKQGKIVITIHKDVTASLDKFQDFLGVFYSLRRKFGLDAYCKMVTGTRLEKVGSEEVEVSVDPFTFVLDVATIKQFIENSQSSNEKLSA